MRAMKFKLMAGMIMAALALAGLPLFGQGGTDTSSGVARVSLIRGDVSMQRGDSGEWVAVTVNTPLVPGDTVATGTGSRAEVQLDYSNVVRLADNSQVKIADLNDSRIQLQVARGTVDLAVFQNNQANSEVDTPNVAVSPLQPGTYRLDVNSDSLSLVTVRDGQAQISTPQGSTNVNAGQQITVEGTQNPQYQIVDARPLDNWDDWNRDRNGVINSAQSYDHVNRYYTGAQDLNASGRWSYVPGYDWCWTPYVDAGWVPYSNGRWVWEPFYGWTWVSYDSWGWAPYHYGRWFFWDNAWCWWPGAVTPFYRPLWAPAYVSFIGFGYGYHHFGFGFGYGFSSIGWCPLGPRDRFHRWWGHDRDHSFNVVNINNYYGRDGGRGGRGYRGSNMGELGSNFHVRRAIVTMDANRFGKEAVPHNRRLVDSRMLRNAEVVHGTLPVVPTRASLRATNRAAAVPAAARNRANNTHFFTRRTVATPNANRSFNNQAASIRRMVETHNVNAPGANRAGANTEANRGSSLSRPAGQQNQGVGRRSPAPVVRENPQGRQNFGSANGRNVQANGSNMQRFGTGGPAGAQARGNQRGETSAQVFRQGPQQRQGGSNDPRATQAGQAGFRHFGTGSPAAQARDAQGRQGAAPVVRQNPQPRQNGGSQPSRSNFRSFSGNPPAGTREVPNQNPQRFSQAGNPSVRGQQNNGGFRQFAPQPAPRSGTQNEGRVNNNFRPAPRNEGGNRAGWNQFRPQTQAPQQRAGGGFYNRGTESQGYSQPRYQGNPSYNAPRNYSRPPLRFNNPIVSEPRARNNGGGPGYYGGSRPSYQQRSAPSYRGNSGGGSRPSYSAPSHSSGGGGGGHSGGGGGGHSGGGGGGGGGGHSGGGGGGGHRR